MITGGLDDASKKMSTQKYDSLKLGEITNDWKAIPDEILNEEG